MPETTKPTIDNLLINLIVPSMRAGMGLGRMPRPGESIPTTVHIKEASQAIKTLVETQTKELAEAQKTIEYLRRFESYVCGVIAMGNQADLTVESLPLPND